jgi:peptide/nickel transport system substrate-binding protein
MKRHFFKAIFLLGTLLAMVQPAIAVSNQQLTMGINQEFENLNPIVKQMMATTYILDMVGPDISTYDADWNHVCDVCVTVPSFENGLMRIKEESGKKVVYVDWELHPKAMWADGTPMTGHDVKLSWEIARSNNVSSGEREVYDRFADVIVDKKNPKKFTMKTRELRYDANILATFDVVPAHIEGAVWEKTKNTQGAYEKQSVYNTDPTNPGLYYGAYKVTEIKLGSHVVLEPNPHFFGSGPHIKKIIFKLISDTSSMEASLLSGEIDMICELGLTFDQILSFEKRLEKDKTLSEKYKVVMNQSMVYEHIDLNLRNPLFKDKRVRQALLYGIDREKLVQALFEGKQKVALHNVHPKDVYYTDDVKKYPYDPKKAMALLEEAGWKKGPGGIYHKDGQKFEFTLMTTAQNKTRELVEVFLQQAWKKIGLKVNIKNEPARVFFGETVSKGKYPAMAMFAYIASPDNPPKSTMYSKNIPTESNGFSGQNTGAWVNVEVDQIFDEIYSEMDAEKRQTLMKRFLQIYTEEVPVIPLYNRADAAVIPASMNGFQISGHQFYSSREVHKWNLGN